MAVLQINFTDKVKFQESPLAEINKLTDANINEIKNVVNNNAQEVTDRPGNDSLAWTFNGDTADTDPGTNKWKQNNVTETAVTFLYLSKDNFNGVDYHDYLVQIPTGSYIAIQAKKISKDIFLYVTSGPVIDATTYVKIPVTFVSQGDAVAAGFVVNTQQYFTFLNVRSYGHIIQKESVSQNNRSKLNFQGFLVEDDAGNDATKVTAPTPQHGAVHKDLATNYIFKGQGKYYISSVLAEAFHYESDGTNAISSVTFSVRTGFTTNWETITLADLVNFLNGTFTTAVESYVVGSATNWEVRFEAAFGASAPSKDFGVTFNLFNIPNS